MRKIILLALLITGFNCFSQPIKQYIGSNRTMIISKGTLKADSGFYVTVRDTLNHPYRDSIGLLTFRPQDKKLYISDGAKFILVSGIQIEDLPVYTASQGVELIDNDFRLFDNGAGAGTRFQWSPSKSAFRAGLAIGDEWDNSNIGNYSFATGIATTANAHSSIAMGNSTTASGASSFAVGNSTTASGLTSMSINNNNTASGAHSFASGNNTQATEPSAASFGNITQAIGRNSFVSGEGNIIKPMDGFGMGSYNDTTGNSNFSNDSRIATDPIFVIGNGLDENNRSNALKILRNGKGTVKNVWGYESDVSPFFTSLSFVNKAFMDNALALKQDNIGYIPENVDNKENIVINNSTVKYPTVNLLNTGLGTKVNITDTAAMLANYLLKNTSITGATKTKITYDTKGLVTDGVDATTADIAPSTNRNYVTDAQQIVIDNTSGVNTGDQDLSGLQPLDADLTAIAGLTPSNDDIIQRKAGAWTNRTPAQFKTDLALTKSDVGLGNVDNTSDLNKPVSTATQAALDLKLNIADADEKAQDAIGAMVDPTLVYNDGLPSLGRAAINGDIAISAGSNTAAISAGAIVNADINAAAAIDATKIANGSVANAAFQFVSGLTSSAQTQIDNKVTKGGDAGANLEIGTTTLHDVIFKANNTARVTIDGATGYIRRGTGSAIHGLQLYGTGAGSVLAFGDNFGTVPYVGLGEKGQIDSDQLEAYGQKGFYVTTGTYGSTSMITVQQDGDIILGGETQVPNAELTVIGDEDVSGNLNVQGTLTAGNILTASAALNFASTLATAVSTLTINVPGADVGDPVFLGVPNGSVTTTATFWAWVSAAGVVSVRYSPKATEDPASATFNVIVFD